MPDSSGDSGLLGWKDWKLPNPNGSIFMASDTTPDPNVDGSYKGNQSSKDNPGSQRLIPHRTYNPVVYPNASPAWTLHYMFVSPMIKTVFTDMSGTFGQAGMRCEKFEKNALECMEYYGVTQGLDACKDVYDDLMECKYKTKRKLRVQHMARKRHFDNYLEWLQGKRTYAELYPDPPKYNSYLSPYHDPTKTMRQQGGLT